MPRATARHSRITPALHALNDSPVPAMSCADLAKQLPRLWAEDDRLHVSGMRALPSTPSYRTLVQDRANLITRIQATEDMILATPATTLGDAAAQVLIAASHLDSAIGKPDEMDRRALAALVSAFRAVASAAGVEPADMAASIYGLPNGDEP